KLHYNTTSSFITTQLQGSGQLHGYRFMHERCRLAGLHVSRGLINQILSSLDPEGVLRRRLIRRRYNGKGPNFLWHPDSYDKLKPYGIGINGCIDGFTRYIIWMEAYVTNSNPRVIAGYYLRSVINKSGCPKIIRSDRGTENVHVNRLQEFLREDDMNMVQGNCVLQGSSHGSQRIDSWWSRYRKQNAEYWITEFHRLQATGHLLEMRSTKNE
ncbi:UNVERIFIED_CONTAM: hypothetical protein FKN15_071616, partial [Acipenser sinensis]